MHAPATSAAATDRMTIGELTTCSGVAGKTIRYYEDRGRGPAARRGTHPNRVPALRCTSPAPTAPGPGDALGRSAPRGGQPRPWSATGLRRRVARGISPPGSHRSVRGPRAVIPNSG